MVDWLRFFLLSNKCWLMNVFCRYSITYVLFVAHLCCIYIRDHSSPGIDMGGNFKPPRPDRVVTYIPPPPTRTPLLQLLLSP